MAQAPPKILFQLLNFQSLLVAILQPTEPCSRMLNNLKTNIQKKISQKPPGNYFSCPKQPEAKKTWIFTVCSLKPLPSISHHFDMLLKCRNLKTTSNTGPAQSLVTSAGNRPQIQETLSQNFHACPINHQNVDPKWSCDVEIKSISSQPKDLCHDASWAIMLLTRWNPQTNHSPILMSQFYPYILF